MRTIPFARPHIGVRERAAVRRAIRSGWLTSGVLCEKFEREFAQSCRAAHAVTVSSATAGLHLALVSAGFGKGDVLCVSPYTFAASAAVGVHVGMRVQFVDTERGGYNIDCDLLEQAVSTIRSTTPSRTRIAIMAVHIGGAVCDMKRIHAIATAHACHVIEDAAHCQPLIGEGGARDGGGRGVCAVFSFYATKPITTAEGGIVITDDDRIAARMRLLRTHGMSGSLWERTVDHRPSWSYDIEAHGYKYNLPDPLAAMGRVQLRRAPKHWRMRMAIARYYHHHLRNSRWIEPPHMPEPGREQTHAWHLFLCQLRLSALRIDRDTFIDRMRARGVACSVHYIPLHMTTAYKREYGYHEHDFAQAATHYHAALSLPIYPQLTRGACDRVLHAIEAIGYASKLR